MDQIQTTNATPSRAWSGPAGSKLAEAMATVRERHDRMSSGRVRKTYPESRKLARADYHGNTDALRQAVDRDPTRRSS
jgi:hypothetical protein